MFTQPLLNHSSIRLLFYVVCSFILISLAIGVGQDGPAPSTKLSQFGYYAFVGILAALVANATGAGGGIVFLPVFMSLGLSAAESLATSIAIQCFGMNSGALAWLAHRQIESTNYAPQWHTFTKIVLFASLSSWAGLLIAQYCFPTPPIDIKLLFSLFSLTVGGIIFYRTVRIKQEKVGRSTKLTPKELLGISVSCFIGGAITAWLSVGVGEILAILLIFMGFRVNMAVACAVCVTAVTVLVAIPYHLLISNAVNLDVLVYAAPGALIGGALAKHLATWLGAHRLKLMMSIWIILSALVYLV